jgi:hypothetical protein
VKAAEPPSPNGLGALAPGPGAPPPAAGLSSAVAAMRPVRTRSRLGALALVVALGFAWPVYTLARSPLRPDLGALPPLWVAFGAALWGLAFALSVIAALVPARGEVLPSASRAARVSLWAMGALFLFTAAWTAFAPGLSLRPSDLGLTTLQTISGCGKVVLEVAAPFVVLGFLALRRVLPMGGPRMGLALGAAGGALGGFVLHFLCPLATTGHVLVSHVGAMILASLAGVLLLSALLRR